MKNTGIIIGALVIGTTIGAIAGILLAPEAGSETRKRLAEGAMDLANTLKDRVLGWRDPGSPEQITPREGNPIEGVQG